MPKIHRSTTLALTGTALTALAVAASAVGASAQTTADPSAQITTAVTTSPATAGVAATDYTVSDIAVVGNTWASAQLEPAVGAEVDPATAVLQFSDGAWQVVDLGTAQVGCGIVPADVEAELVLTC